MHPLHPPPRSAPVSKSLKCTNGNNFVLNKSTVFSIDISAFKIYRGIDCKCFSGENQTAEQ